MFRLSEMAVAFAKIDEISDHATPALDKLLRNLSQRHYLPPSTREGRTDLFSIETVCALRLAERAATFGIDRVALDALLRFLQSAPHLPTRFRSRGGVHIALTRIEEALERAREGEDFSVGLSLNANGRVEPKAWFSPDDLPEDAQSILAEVAPRRVPDAVFRLDAARLIREVLAVLDVE